MQPDGRVSEEMKAKLPLMTYRIFSTHVVDGMPVAQAMVVHPIDTYDKNSGRNGQIKEMLGALMDFHPPHTIYASRVWIVQADEPLVPSTMSSDPLDEIYRNNAEKRNLYNRIRAAIKYEPASGDEATKVVRFSLTKSTTT